MFALYAIMYVIFNIESITSNLGRFSNGVEHEVTRKNAAIKQLRAVDPI
jgi:hypothetical protein